MGADVSRVRMDPLRDHSAVGVQQGRVLPDADLNELVDIVDRRLRAQVADQRPAGVAFVSELTPDAFRIQLDGDGLTIGRGRMYVDGLLAENHGNPDAPAFDPVLAERAYDGVIAYDAQPYWTPPKLDRDGAALAYLDVWQRELTHLNAPYLVEPAIGVDTTTRTQTVWQVKLLTGLGDVSCADQLPEWDELVAPSTARLTTGTVPVDPAEDVCEVPPVGGYRGLENHLYRVELHDEGSFKWSRDNASIGSRVVEVVNATTLRLARVRRDDVARFADGDWVEVLDDARELAGRPGELRRITVDEAAGTISFTTPLPGGLAHQGTESARNLRVVLWNQGGEVKDVDGNVVADLTAATATGTIPIPPSGAAVVLERGVTVAFDGTGRPGDHWVFAARTADASVEVLTGAPPRGVHHHYARLAVVTWPDTVTDCRPRDEPSEGCPCEQCVTPDEHNSGARPIQHAIQRAIDHGGGTVTLCPGTYRLDGPIRVGSAKSIVLRGRGARLVSDGLALALDTVKDVTVEGLEILCAGEGGGAAVTLTACGRVRVQDCVIVAKGRVRDREGWTGIVLDAAHFGTVLLRNTIRADVGIGTSLPRADVLPGIYSDELRIEDNMLRCRRRGVDVTAPSVHVGRTVVAGNTVVGTREAGIAMTGFVDPDGPDAAITIRDNIIEPQNGTGILTSARVVVAGNEVTYDEAVARAHAVRVAAEPPAAAPADVRITGNRMTGAGGYGVTVDAPVRVIVVDRNVVDRCGGGIRVYGRGPKEHVTVDGNVLRDLVAVPEPDLSERPGRVFVATTADAFAIGIDVVTGKVVQVSGNVIDGVAADAEDAVAVGIAIVLADDVQVHDNTLRRIGRPDGRHGGGGIGVGLPLGAVSVARNTIDSGVAGPKAFRPQWGGISIAIQAAPSTVETARGDIVMVEGGRAHARGFPALGWAVHVDGNVVGAGGEWPAILVQIPGDVNASGNTVTGPLETESPGILVEARTAGAHGNRVATGRPSIVLETPKGAWAAVGNLTSGGVRADLGSVPSPWHELNPSV